MKIVFAAGLLALSSASAAADYGFFIAVDAASERDSIKNDYVNASVAIGLKGPGKMEYSARISAAEKENGSHSRNIEARMKKSFDFGLPFSPYVALRVGQKTSNADKRSLSHWAADLGVRLPLANQFALDLSARYRTAFSSHTPYDSLRYQAAMLYEIDPANVVGLRYTISTSKQARGRTQRLARQLPAQFISAGECVPVMGKPASARTHSKRDKTIFFYQYPAIGLSATA